jgi:uncharacterized repeat protein (TIGR03803 family)
MDSAGNLYGTTASGGDAYGTVFEVAAGSGTITTLAAFNGTNAANPHGGLVMDSAGNLYGTTASGGDAYGTVFEVAAGSGTPTTLASFTGSNGAHPLAGLVMDGSGNLYGTTDIGGALGYGTVFELAHGSSTITILASFNGTDGANPFDGLVLDSSGNLYGTTEAGGASTDGTVFELAKGSGTITTLASFNGTNGSFPYPGLLMDSRGNLYGTTFSGGASNDGTVFELTKGSGTITTLASFSGKNGSNPEAPLIMDGSGNLYGTTEAGGASNAGTVFELAHGASKITTRASFNGKNGSNPVTGLVMNGSGNLYGTTGDGGAFGDGTVFELAKGATKITTLASFNGTNGANPYGGLLLDGSGDLFGTTNSGGPGGEGTVFELPAAAAAPLAPAGVRTNKGSLSRGVGHNLTIGSGFTPLSAGTLMAGLGVPGAVLTVDQPVSAGRTMARAAAWTSAPVAGGKDPLDLWNPLPTETSPGVWTFSFTLNLAPGNYTLYAHAEDRDGILGDLAALTLTVQ